MFKLILSVVIFMGSVSTFASNLTAEEQCIMYKIAEVDVELVDKVAEAQFQARTAKNAEKLQKLQELVRLEQELASFTNCIETSGSVEEILACIPAATQEKIKTECRVKN